MYDTSAPSAPVIMMPTAITAPPPSRTKTCIRRAELIVNGILFGIWNNVSTLINANNFFDEGHRLAGILSIAFLFFPGVVTSLGFIILHWMGNRAVRKVPPKGVILVFFALLVGYPVIPILLCVYTLFRGGRLRELAVLSKLLEGFLDDGPQFVLRLVVFVLYGVGKHRDKDDVILILSMITSFCALVYFGLKFNERTTHGITKWALALPMFLASVGSRAFTLAVFLKETTFPAALNSTTTTTAAHPVATAAALTEKITSNEWIGGLIIICLYICINIGSFRLCGQDIIRSIVFGMSSTLIPAGYNNDPYFYQCPHQAMWAPPDTAYIDTVGQVRPDEIGMLNGAGAEASATTTTNSDATPTHKMRSALFLMLHTVTSTVLLSSCAVYIIFSRKLNKEAINALILPQFMAVVPGFFFTLARSILLVEHSPCVISSSQLSDKVWEFIRIGLSILFGLFAYVSILVMGGLSIVWVFIGAKVGVIDDDD